MFPPKPVYGQNQVPLSGRSQYLKVPISVARLYSIYYIHVEPYIVGKLGYTPQLLTRYYCNLSCTECVIILQDLPSSFFCPTSCSSQESEGFFFRQATYKGTYVEAVESARAGLSPKKGDVRRKRKEKKKTKEGGLSPQEGANWVWALKPRLLMHRILKQNEIKKKWCFRCITI